MTLPFSDTLQIFSIDPACGLAEVAGSPLMAGTGVGAIAGLEFNAAGDRLFGGAATGGGTVVDEYDFAGGVPSPVAGAPFVFPGIGNNSNVVLLGPDETKLFVSNQGSASVTVLDVAADGSLAPIAGAPFPAPGAFAPSGMAIDPSTSLLFVADLGNAVYVYHVAPDGSLALVSGSPFPTGINAALLSLAFVPTVTPCSPDVTVRVGDGVRTDPEFCVDVELANPGTAVRAVHGTLVDVPDEFELTRVECVGRAVGFDCSADQTVDNRIRFVVDLDGRCVDAGTGPILRVCLRDKEPMCPVASSVVLEATDVRGTDCVGESVTACTENGRIACGVLGDCLVNDGVIDIFDVLHKIDILLERVAPTPSEAVLCDDNCDGAIDIFDVLEEIDAILERIPQPLTCLAAGAASAPTTAGPSAPRVALAGERAIRLTNRGSAVRGLELTLVPESGPVKVVGARGTRRTRGFVVAAHQTDPTGAVKVVVVSLAGKEIPVGDGAVARLMTSGSKRGRLRLTDVRVVERPRR